MSRRLFNQERLVLDTRDLDVVLRPVLYREMVRHLGHFPGGAIVVLATRGHVPHVHGEHAREALALMGAVPDLARLRNSGYAAPGALGARPGTALEQDPDKDHARVQVGRPPPPWREVARYRIY
jgi:hypothetical protein